MRLQSVLVRLCRSVMQLCFLLACIGMIAACGSATPSAPPRSNKTKSLAAEPSFDDGEAKSQDDDDDDDDDDENDHTDNDSVDEGDEDDDDDSDDKDKDDEDDKEPSALIIKSLSNDEDEAMISVREPGGSWRDFSWPEDKLTVPGLCRKGGTARIEVRVIEEDRTILSSLGEKFAILAESSTSIKVGYEESTCNGPKCQDDNVAELSCESGSIELAK